MLRRDVLFVKFHTAIVHVVRKKIVLEILLFYSKEIRLLVIEFYISSVKSLAFVLALRKNKEVGVFSLSLSLSLSLLLRSSIFAGVS